MWRPYRPSRCINGNRQRYRRAAWSPLYDGVVDTLGLVGAVLRTEMPRQQQQREKQGAWRPIVYWPTVRSRAAGRNKVVATAPSARLRCLRHRHVSENFWPPVLGRCGRRSADPQAIGNQVMNMEEALWEARIFTTPVVAPKRMLRFLPFPRSSSIRCNRPIAS